MALLDWLTGKNKSLSTMNRQELRRQELLLDKECSQLLKRIEKIGNEKQALFDRGRARRRRSCGGCSPSSSRSRPPSSS